MPNPTKKPFKRVFAESQQKLRWSRFKHFKAEEMLKIVRDDVFPHFRKLDGGTTFGEYMQDAQLMILKPNLLVQAVNMIDALPIIDGKDAIEDPAFDPRHPKFTEWSVILVSPRQSTYVYGAYNISFVDIESLDIRNGSYTGDGSITYTDKFGTVRGYGAFA